MVGVNVTFRIILLYELNHTHHFPFSNLRYNTKNGTQMGLAMTRSIGDLSAHKAGVSCLPYEIEKKLEEDDEFVILGSDGLFDVMKNDEILTIVNGYMATLPPDEHRYAWKPQEVAKLLVATARSRWIKYSDYIDDITCCVSIIFICLIST